MKHVNTREFKVSNATSLAKQPTLINFDTIDDEKKDALKDVSKDLSKLQEAMYANNRYGVLICLQGMDTSGKDSLIREIFKYFNARGVMVYSFKQPTSQELRHDYLWRHYIALPARGKFGVFNRTHYENVLVTRVHPEYILGENLPGIDSLQDIDEKFWDNRFEQINNFEKYIAENGTIIFKFFLNLSKDEQRRRLLRRLDLQEKNWKFSAGDLKERKLWDKYQECYEEAINKTSKEHAPWFVIPADNKKAARVIVATILLEALKKYKDIKEPELSAKIKANLGEYRNQLEKETE